MVKKITLGSRKANEKPLIIAGPCSVENYEVMDKTVSFLKNLGLEFIRGGAFKPRTSPYSFQGLGLEGVEILREMKNKYNIKIVSEVLDIRDIDEMIETVDIIQVGSRNMYNYPLLRELGKTNKPVLLKRGISATIEEWLNAAEYIAVEGNGEIILCERGIRTFESYTRNTLDLNAVPVVKEKTSLKVIVDPSHGTGRRELVGPMSLASIAAGADGLLIEVHPEPVRALSDGFQSVSFEEFELIYKKIMDTFKCIHKR